MTSLVAQMVKCLPTMWETWVQSLGQEDLLEKEMTTYSSILAWRVPWVEEPGRLWSVGSQRVRHDKRLHLRSHTFIFLKKNAISLNHIVCEAFSFVDAGYISKRWKGEAFTTLIVLPYFYFGNCGKKLSHIDFWSPASGNESDFKSLLISYSLPSWVIMVENQFC